MADEFRLIAELFAPLAAGFPGALGLTDDAALLAAEPGSDTVVTVDAMVAGVPARVIGYMCERGETLEFDAAGSATTSYGQEYIKTPQGIVEKVVR